MSSNGDDGVLADVTNKVNRLQVNEESLKRVKDAQWVDAQEYNYDAYNSSDKAPRGAAPSEAEGGNDNAPTWAARAARYEWSDDYGDVGPEDPELERMLFGGENKMQAGSEFAK